MKKKLCLFLACLVSVCLFSGCGGLVFLKGADGPSAAKSAEEPKDGRRFARDYLNQTKSEIEAALGEKDQETYYGGATVFKLKNADMWFWFGGDDQQFEDVPQDAKCVFVLATLRDAADFDDSVVTKDVLSAKLGFNFSEPELDEHDGVYEYTAQKDDVQCTVSCAEDGTALAHDDYVIYKLINE